MEKLFLLGGADLEMRAIRRLLKRGGYRFIDRGLAWNDAKLSAFADLFDETTEFVGVELYEDVDPPLCYTRIDHHNDSMDRPSSLEQLSAMLGIGLSRFETLVAANDKGYISAMRAMGAAPREIGRIRTADRRAQGVSAAEEAQAEYEAAAVRRRDSGLFVVDSALEHFSPLIDRIGKRPLLLRGERQWSFYGDKIVVEKLAERFAEEIAAGSVYYGGNPAGYFGFAETWFEHHYKEETMTEIEKFIDGIDTVYSYHTFMFPFRFGSELLDKNDSWREMAFAIDSAERFNEKNYFYSYVQKALFTGKGDNQDQGVSRYFEYREQEGHYRITAQNRTYDLEIDGISLRLFRNKIAIIAFNLINRSHRDPASVLMINDFGRRLYPQFLGEHLTQETREAFLPQSVEISLEGAKVIREDFSQYEDMEKLNDLTWHMPKFLGHFLGDLKGVEPILDDRMYVVCQLLDNTVSAGLRMADEEPYVYETDDFWYRYVFVDAGEAMCQNPKMKRELTAQSTYGRWSGYGTLYGITRYSFMLLSDGSGFSRNVLNAHIRTVYFQMVSLLLAYRAMMLHFSDAIADAMGSDDAKAETVFRDYLEFQNRIYFREVTAQEQGIELFNLGRERMRLDAQLEELDHDIAELHDFVDLKAEQMRNEKLNTLNYFAGIMLPATVVSGILGMNTLPDKWTDKTSEIFWGLCAQDISNITALIVTLVVTAGIVGWLKYKSKKGEK